MVLPKNNFKRCTNVVNFRIAPRLQLNHASSSCNKITRCYNNKKRKARSQWATSNFQSLYFSLSGKRTRVLCVLPPKNSLLPRLLLFTTRDEAAHLTANSRWKADGTNAMGLGKQFCKRRKEKMSCIC